jgi:hypothetical protein
VKLPGALWGVFAVGAALGLLTANPLLTAAAIMLLPVFMTLLWRPGEPPVLLFAVSFQWLQVTAKVFHANVLGIDVTLLSEYALGDLPSLRGAIWLGLVGLVVLAVGMRVGLWKLGANDEERARRESREFSVGRAFLLYLALTAASTVLESLVWSVGGFIQVVRAATDVKWVGFFLLGYLVLKRREGYLLFLIAVLIEFVAGIGFFSGFKIVLFVTLIVIFTVHHRLKAGTVGAGAVLFALLLILGAGWTSIKHEYRTFLNQGTGMQSTVVSRSAQFDKLAELVGDLEWEDIQVATGGLFERIAYVDYFALTTEYVPEYMPHEGGVLWEQAILHVLKPRVLFPDKPPLVPDSEITMRYTGLHLASVDQGTSISIGYMGESYVDFGPYGMFVPVFILGVLWGLMYYYFVTRARVLLIGYAFAMTLLLNAYQFEMTGIKLLGGVTGKFLVLALIMYFAEKHIAAWLQKGAPRVRAPRGTLAHEGG